jgi:NitT/TauT family transport system permease protein
MNASAKLQRVLTSVWPPVVFGAAIVLVWHFAVKVFDWKPFFIPAPSAVWDAFRNNATLIREAAWVSGSNAFVGLVVGAVIGVGMSFLLMRFSVLNEIVNPLAIAANAIPIVVLVSVFTNQFSGTSEIPRRLMVTLIVYFIILVNVAKGLRDVEATHLELLRSYAASPLDVIRKVRVPNAVPYLFTALKIAAPVAVITAFVAEYFGGRQNGLGTRIATNISNSKNAVAWAYVAGACLLGLTFYLVFTAVESLINQHRGSSPHE